MLESDTRKSAVRTNIILIVATLVVVAGGVYYFWAARQPMDLAEIGMPMYPGANVEDGIAFQKKWGRGDPMSVKAVALSTEDSPTRVVDFYQHQLKEKVRLLEMIKTGVPSALLSVGAGTGQKWLAIKIDPQTGRTVILITTLREAK